MTNLEIKLKEDSDLYLKFEICKRHLKDRENAFPAFYPTFSLHNTVHSNTIINNLDSFKLSEILTSELNTYEIFLLLSSAYLHDIGMIIINEKDKEKCERDNLNLFGYIRDIHHIKSYEYIKKNRQLLKLDDFDAENIALISKGHRRTDIKHDSDYENQIYTRNGNYTIRLKLLAALLRLSDELDCSFSRINMELREILEQYKKFDIITQLHWLKHYYTVGTKFEFVESDRELPYIALNLKFKIPIQDYEEKFIKPFIINPIKKEIEYLNSIFKENGFYFKISKIDCKKNISKEKIPKELLAKLFKFMVEENKIKILIIDDENSWRKLFKLICRDLGYKVDTASNSIEGMKKISKSAYHLILLDLKMPDKTNTKSEDAGIELLKEIKELNQSYTIVIITALSDAKTTRDCFINGAYDFIVKGWEHTKIISMLKNAIEMNFYKIDEL